MIEKCQQAIDSRNQFAWEDMVFYCYPPDIESSNEISQLMSERLSPQVQFGEVQLLYSVTHYLDTSQNVHVH